MFPTLHTKRFEECNDARCAVSPDSGLSSGFEGSSSSETAASHYAQFQHDYLFNPRKHTFPQHKCSRFMRWIQSLKHPLAPDMFLPNSIYRARFYENEDVNEAGSKDNSAKPWVPWWAKKGARSRLVSKAATSLDLHERVNIYDYEDDDVGQVAEYDGTTSPFEEDADVVKLQQDEATAVELSGLSSGIETALPTTVPTPQLLSRPCSNRVRSAQQPHPKSAVQQVSFIESETLINANIVNKKKAKKDDDKPSSKEKQRAAEKPIGKLPVLRNNKGEQQETVKQQVMSFPARLYQNHGKSYKKFGRYQNHSGSGSVVESEDRMQLGQQDLDDINSSYEGSELGVADSTSLSPQPEETQPHPTMVKTSAVSSQLHDDQANYVKEFEMLVNSDSLGVEPSRGIISRQSTGLVIGRPSVLSREKTMESNSLQPPTLERYATSPVFSKSSPNYLSSAHQSPRQSAHTPQQTVNKAAVLTYSLLPRDYKSFQKRRSSIQQLPNLIGAGATSDSGISGMTTGMKTDSSAVETTLTTGLGSNVDLLQSEKTLPDISITAAEDNENENVQEARDSDRASAFNLLIERKRQKEQRLTLPSFNGGLSSCGSMTHLFNDTSQRKSKHRGPQFSSLTEQLLYHYKNQEIRRIKTEAKKIYEAY